MLRRHSLGVVRERVIGDGFGERISVVNYTEGPERARLTLTLDADYADIFELRGVVRTRRGERMPNRGDGSLIEFGYTGLDDAVRQTFVRISPQMTVMDADGRPTGRVPRNRAGDTGARFDARALRAGQPHDRCLDRRCRARQSPTRRPSASTTTIRQRDPAAPRCRGRA